MAKDWQNVDIDKEVVQKILKPMKDELGVRSYSDVIKRLYLDYKTWNH